MPDRYFYVSRTRIDGIQIGPVADERAAETLAAEDIDLRWDGLFDLSFTLEETDAHGNSLPRDSRDEPWVPLDDPEDAMAERALDSDPYDIEREVP